MGNLVYRRTFTVEWGHCDPAGIVFNSRFFEFFDWSSWLLFERALGVRPSALGPTFGIVGIPLVGSVESLNVSVAAGICLYATQAARHSL